MARANKNVFFRVAYVPTNKPALAPTFSSMASPCALVKAMSLLMSSSKKNPERVKRTTHEQGAWYRLYLFFMWIMPDWHALQRQLASVVPNSELLDLKLRINVSHHLKGVELPPSLGPRAQFFPVPLTPFHSKNMSVPHWPHLRKDIRRNLLPHCKCCFCIMLYWLKKSLETYHQLWWCQDRCFVCLL